jgi:biopolymer transport protein ExbB
MEDICRTKRANGVLKLAANAAALFAIISILLLLGAVDGHAWWDNKWDFRKKITFDTTPAGADIKESLAEVPVLIRLHAGNFKFSTAKDDGSDIRFLSADEKVVLKHHIEKYDRSEEIALVWVRLPRLLASSSQDFVWMYYGNKSAPAAADPGATYDNNHIVVYHMGEREGAPRDATAFGNHAAEFNGGHGTPSVIGSGYTFNGESDKVLIRGAQSMNFSGGFTFSAWVRIPGAQRDAYLFSREEGGQSIVVGLNGTALYARVSGGKQTITTERSVDLAPQKWHHVAVTMESTRRITVYLDGIETTWAKFPVGIPSMLADLAVGASTKEGHYFAGDLDEVQISNVARPAGWIRAAFRGQGPDVAMVSVLEQEENTGSENLTLHYLRVVARHISFDGWLIIGILVIMGAASAVVFLQKTYSLRINIRENAEFSDAFLESRDVKQLEGRGEDFESSQLFNLYRTGCQELEKWSGAPGAIKANPGIAPKTLIFIRAAMEQAMVKESQKLSAWLVLLTMGITGGPFLGLLGTVWGVMNTFAGMADAGEANLLAIAPGVASALACTLAGLLVAIPALFAYNYLMAKIRNLNADMGLFIDLFSVRLEGGE